MAASRRILTAFAMVVVLWTVLLIAMFRSASSTDRLSDAVASEVSALGPAQRQRQKLRVAPHCKPWCTSPCSELNGNVYNECGACERDSAEFKCGPGAPGMPSDDEAARMDAVRRRTTEVPRATAAAAPADDVVPQPAAVEAHRAEELAEAAAKGEAAALPSPPPSPPPEAQPPPTQTAAGGAGGAGANAYDGYGDDGQ
eukprot:1530013-Prymnesium_polylepis.1